MLQVKKILFPTDFSPCASAALTHALMLAEQFDAELHMLHAVVLREDDPYSPAYHFAEPEEIFTRLEEISRSEMASLMAAHRDRQLRIKEIERRGLYPGPVVLEYAQHHAIDLIVMGTHGRRGPAHLLLGSVAEEIVRRAPCPVLTVREQREETPPLQSFRHILVPLDFSDPARHSLALACDLAATYGGQLELLHVVEELVQPGFYGPVEGLGPMTDHAEMAERTRAALERVIESAGPRVPYRTHVSFGRPGREISAFTEDHDIDLIVIATQGLTGLERFFFGSTAEQVVRRAPCPVLTVKATGRQILRKAA